MHGSVYDRYEKTGIHFCDHHTTYTDNGNSYLRFLFDFYDTLKMQIQTIPL